MSNPPEIWVKVCRELEKVITPDALHRWFSSIVPISYEAGRLVLGVENAIYQYWIEENYLNQLRECATLAVGREVKISFDVVGSKDRPTPSAEEHLLQAEGKEKSKPLAGELVSRYTFESFVAGVNSQFAHAAATAVADAPARTYNPLFIHGSVGLGKTHLLHAIGHRIMQKKKGAKIVYVTSEQFTNEFISAIQHGELVKFRRRFRQADCLLIDDVQFFSGKDRSQEEFFHTFNTLFDGNRQIVLSSDSPPGDVANLQKRLVSRFEWGLSAELQSPDIETRLAILRKKTSTMQVRLGESVLHFIAERVKTNVRRLEGALNRVAAWAALHDRHITPAQVEELLKDFIQQETKPIVTIELIQRRVAEGYDLRVADMTSKRRPAHIALPRMVAMYLSRKMTGKSLQEIGESFGGRDHGTVLHACKTITSKMQGDERLHQMVGLLTHKLEEPAER
jgi:chromosomal replication initiator protein